MRKITLICAGGFSTSMLVANMDEVAKAQGLAVTIRAAAEAKFAEHEKDTDILLLGPQVSYLIEDFKAKYASTGMKIAVIDSMDYGMMNGEKILQDALKL